MEYPLPGSAQGIKRAGDQGGRDRDVHAGNGHDVGQATARKGQGQARVHFGLGEAKAADVVEIRWPDGKKTTHAGLAVDRYHTIRPDAR